MRLVLVAWLVAVVMLVGYGGVRADDREEKNEEKKLTVEISSADHEIGEGYFALGEDATLMVEPGSSLHAFLARHRGQKVTITFA